MKRQKQKQLTAHDKILIFDNLRYLLEGLEEYIEKAGFYPDFKNRRQLQNITIPRQRADGLTADSAEDFFKTNLILYVSMVNQAPPSEREKLVQEYYKWINSVGIDPDNCPQKLKNFLIEIKNVLEGKSERIIQQTKKYLDNKDNTNPYPTNSQDTLTLFGLIQKPLDKNREQAKLYEGESYEDVEITNKLGGNAEQGQQAFSQIANSVSGSNFNFYQQRGPQQYSNSEIIQDVKTNPQNWRVDEIITGYDNWGEATEGELALIHNSAEVGWDGAVDLPSQPIYLAQRFNSEQINQINQALRIAQTTSQQGQKHRQQFSQVEAKSVKAVNKSSPNDSNIGGIVTVFFIISALLIASAAVIRKRIK